MNKPRVFGGSLNSLDKNRLGRLLTAMVTPFDAQGEIDYQQARRLALALLDSGSDGVVVSGTTGEAPTLSKEEKLRLFSEIKSAVADRGAVVAGTGNNDTKESQEVTKEAEKIGVDACLLVVPYYNRPTQQGLWEHFKDIAQSTTLPCIIYNVPSRTVTNLAADTLIKLSQIDNIVGVKEASGNLGQIVGIIQGTREDFLVYSGNDSDTFPILALGGYGVISVASHLVGIQIKDMMEKFLNSEAREAAKIHRHLLPLINALFIVSNPVPLKWALNYAGFPVGKPRLPLVEPDEKSANLIQTTLKNYKIDLPIPKG
ncbi:MAG: 4-hydroxy-tetrahydrodipicolinate synthase [Dehalococcoidia bacterium]|jgi:4-hydroxy-tetrahydrodipicolinate synthase|nr:MAG: 4-hydroxy-tetrahydrodipicolinate synthase [Dehalococcoidia bacterium]TEU16665.1 MAG: 4-hydroxy-tetrahydrodipicolinate synthase [Dehalococcoidia bacterium]